MRDRAIVYVEQLRFQTLIKNDPNVIYRPNVNGQK